MRKEVAVLFGADQEQRQAILQTWLDVGAPCHFLATVINLQPCERRVTQANRHGDDLPLTRRGLNGIDPFRQILHPCQAIGLALNAFQVRSIKVPHRVQARICQPGSDDIGQQHLVGWNPVLQILHHREVAVGNFLLLLGSDLRTKVGWLKGFDVAIQKDPVDLIVACHFHAVIDPPSTDIRIRQVVDFPNATMQLSVAVFALQEGSGNVPQPVIGLVAGIVAHDISVVQNTRVLVNRLDRFGCRERPRLGGSMSPTPRGLLQRDQRESAQLVQLFGREIGRLSNVHVQRDSIPTECRSRRSGAVVDRSVTFVGCGRCVVHFSGKTTGEPTRGYNYHHWHDASTSSHSGSSF
ncbi:hypothetical protein-transmembrane prediction [Rhodopirellula baltica SH 1]|uniref:Uncharacterized protein n=1 Tax=Rhodopirellula baltica (strain DSM 10527 / NCIMB 13988 / SH1) TaxID=243090 RepID=Q7UGW6_RHOBA|nr:hypothetical protein-transmembrane prediction [Rhodopirellula baltica SH 1]